MIHLISNVYTSAFTILLEYIQRNTSVHVRIKQSSVASKRIWKPEFLLSEQLLLLTNSSHILVHLIEILTSFTLTWILSKDDHVK